MSYDFGLSEGATLSRPCPDCGCVVTILAPEKNGHSGDHHGWARWRNLVRPQIMWPMLCPSCKAWWNERIDSTERPAGSRTTQQGLTGGGKDD